MRFGILLSLIFFQVLAQDEIDVPPLSDEFLYGETFYGARTVTKPTLMN